MKELAIQALIRTVSITGVTIIRKQKNKCQCYTFRCLRNTTIVSRFRQMMTRAISI